VEVRPFRSCCLAILLGKVLKGGGVEGKVLERGRKKGGRGKLLTPAVKLRNTLGGGIPEMTLTRIWPVSEKGVLNNKPGMVFV